MRSCYRGLFLFLGMLLLLCFSSCNSIRPYYAAKVQDWAAQGSETSPKTYELYFTSNLAARKDRKFQEAFGKVLDKAGSESQLVMLGNMFPARGYYSDELDVPKGEIRKHFSFLENFKGKTFYLAGPEEWGKNRRKGHSIFEELEEEVEDALDLKKLFKPSDACPGPKAYQLSNSLVLLVINSQWFVQGEPEGITRSRDCNVQNKAQFFFQLEALLKEHQNRKVIIATHHGFESNGNHGGKFSWKDHLFPLTRIDPCMYFPLPLVGSLYPAARSVAGTREDVSHPNSYTFRNTLRLILQTYRNTLLISGNDPGMQFHSEQNYEQAYASAAPAEYLRRGFGASYTDRNGGYGRITTHEDGSVWVEFFALDSDGSFDRHFKTCLREAGSYEPEPQLSPQKRQFKSGDSVRAVATYQYKVKAFKRFLLGQHYRDAWMAEVPAVVLDVSEENGGMRATRKGGGLQTRSLRLEDRKGRQFVLRSVTKNPERALPGFLRGTLAANVVNDQISASHPYAAIPVAHLAAAAGIPHANPRLVWVERDERLHPFESEFGNELYLYEEKASGNRKDVASFGRPKEIVNTLKMIKRTRGDHEDLIDQQAMVKARVFDNFINDWDRHEGQWKWGVFKENGMRYYRPIPQDRDQSFYYFDDGALNWFVTRKFIARTMKFQTMDDKINSLAGLNFNARNVDRMFLTEMDRSDWINAAKAIEESMTDEVIDEAFTHWPDTLNTLHGNHITKRLKGRRGRMQEYAAKYYKILARSVTVMGTNKKDLFEVERMENGDLDVKHYKLSKKKEKKEALLYHRTFKRGETREVILHGLKDDDRFLVKGEQDKGILLRMIGGGGNDEVKDESLVRGICRRNQVYDKRKGMQVEGGKETRKLLSRMPDVNDFDWTGFEYNKAAPIITFGVNPDDGILLGAGFRMTTFGFRKEPHASSHSMGFLYAFATGGYEVEYEGEFLHAIRKTDFHIDLNVHGPTYVRNFFGLGNETQLPVIADSTDEFVKNFNRVRIMEFGIYPEFVRRMGDLHAVSIGTFYEYSEVEATNDRLITAGESPFSGTDFDPKHYSGLTLGYTMHRLDNEMLPLRGISWHNQLRWYQDVTDIDRRFLRLQTDLRIYYTLNLPFNVTFANRLGAARNTNDAELYQTLFLGGQENLRGYRRERFTGSSMLFTNTDLRIRLFNVRTPVIPFSVGLLGFMDHGRVWVENESSKRWHHGYGGGLWIAPLDFAVIAFNYAVSREARLFTLGFGFEF